MSNCQIQSSFSLSTLAFMQVPDNFLKKSDFVFCGERRIVFFVRTSCKL